jgi:hypothetical protein
MKLRFAAIAAAASFAFAAHAADNPFEAFKGKVKPGLYEYKTEMDMGAIPGMPPGMGKQSNTIQHCVTTEDVEKGKMGGGGPRGQGMPANCEMKDLKMSGNTATYKMVCTGEHAMSAENTITFRDGGYTLDMVMDMQNMGARQGSPGAPMHMKSHIESKYLGACK